MLSGRKSAKFFRLALAAAFFSYLSVVFGAYSRLSEVPIGCRDGSGCQGKLFTPATARDLGQSSEWNKARNPQQRAWKELVQRYVSGALGLLLLRLTWLGWQLKKRKRNQQVLIPFATMLLSFTLGAAGALAFGLQFKPLVMMTQLLGGLAILGALWWVVLREQKFWCSASPTHAARSLRPRALLALAIVVLSITLGGWSMVNGAGLACPDFPTCQGQWWPPMDFLDAFTRWRDLGLQYDGTLLDLPAATAIHMAHRLSALIALLYLGWLGLRVMRLGAGEGLAFDGLLVLLCLAGEIALGVMQAVAHLPLVLAVVHNAAAALLLLSLITLYHRLRPARVP
jgi:cytochrome c oxidase assembly protein subunit 15